MAALDGSSTHSLFPMPVTSSAKKALRVSLKRRERNYARRATVKSSIKAVEEAVVTSDAAKIKEAVAHAMSQVDRARKTGVLPGNTADRRKSRIVALSRAAKAEAAPAKGKTKKAPAKKG